MTTSQEAFVAGLIRGAALASKAGFPTSFGPTSGGDPSTPGGTRPYIGLTTKDLLLLLATLDSLLPGDRSGYAADDPNEDFDTWLENVLNSDATPGTPLTGNDPFDNGSFPHPMGAEGEDELYNILYGGDDGWTPPGGDGKSGPIGIFGWGGKFQDPPAGVPTHDVGEPRTMDDTTGVTVPIFDSVDSYNWFKDLRQRIRQGWSGGGNLPNEPDGDANPFLGKVALPPGIGAGEKDPTISGDTTPGQIGFFSPFGGSVDPWDRGDQTGSRRQSYGAGEDEVEPWERGWFGPEGTTSARWR